MTLQQKIQHTELIADAIQGYLHSGQTYRLDDGGSYPTHILLPKPQVCGTLRQQRSYAVDKAKEILAGL